MIYHISFPHRPFLQGSIEIFEQVAPNKNRVILITNKQNENNPCEIDNKLLIYKGRLTGEVVDLVNSPECSGVFFYWITNEIIELALSINKEKPIYYRSYGPELNGIIYKDTTCFHEPETKKLLHHTIKRIFKGLFRPLFHILKRDFFNNRRNFQRRILFFQRINFIGTVTQYEYFRLKKKIPRFNAENITSILIRPTKIPSVFSEDAQNIMIGHSSISYNNHADVFKLISQIGTSDAKFIVPLSYGNKIYAEKVKLLGEKMLGDKFVPLNRYLPMTNYNNIIENCHSFISFCFIQQGVANIDRFLLTGGKVYLHINSPIYIDRKNQGFTIFSIQQDLTYDHLYNYKLTTDHKIKNRELLINLFYSDEKILCDTKKIIKVLGV